MVGALLLFQVEKVKQLIFTVPGCLVNSKKKGLFSERSTRMTSWHAAIYDFNRKVIGYHFDFGLISDSRKNFQVNSTVLQLLGKCTSGPPGLCKQLTGGSKGFRPSLLINMVNRIKRCYFSLI